MNLILSLLLLVVVAVVWLNSIIVIIIIISGIIISSSSSVVVVIVFVVVVVLSSFLSSLYGMQRALFPIPVEYISRTAECLTASHEQSLIPSVVKVNMEVECHNMGAQNLSHMPIR
jgi:hypothetical protein